ASDVYKRQAAWCLYRRETGSLAGSARWVLPLLRSLAVFSLVLMLAGPVLHHRRTIGELARVLVFVDASKSMSITDEFMEPSRKQIVAAAYGWLSENAPLTNHSGIAGKQGIFTNEAIAAAFQKFDRASRWQRTELLLLDEHDGLLPRLAKKHNVELWTISGCDFRRLWSTEQGVPMPRLLPGKPDGEATDLGTPINTRIAHKSHERRVAVLLSDGQHNLGSSPLEMAKVAAAHNVPIFTIGVGAVERPQDMALLAARVPDSVFVEDRLRGELTLKDDMPAGQSFSLRIEVHNRTVWEKPFVTERAHLRKIEFDFPIKEPVEAQKKDTGQIALTSLPLTFKVSLAPLAGEKDPTNNTLTFRTRAVMQRRRLLLLDGRPRWEFRYLRNMFERDPQWEVNALVAGTELTDQWERGDKPGQFPATRETLFAYDLVGFGEVPPQLLRPEELEWLKEFVGARGGGLFFVDGQRGALRTIAKGPLGVLLPVEWLGNRPQQLPQSLELTPQGAASAAMRFASDPKENAAIWRSLKPPHWLAPVRVLAGAETLLQAVVGAEKLPLVVLRPFGAGKILYVATDETWRWRYEVGDKYHDPFWHQMAAAIMETPFAVRDKNVALDPGAVTYSEGESAELRVRLRDDRGRIITKGHPTATLYRDGQRVATVALSADHASGTFRGRTPALSPGSYEVRVEPHGLVPVSPDLRAEFYVTAKTETAREMAHLNCNEDLLKQMAQASGGEYYREEDARRLVEKLEPMSKGRIEESDTILWQSWWWFVPVVVLLAVEWLLRKRAGLI
ncbi:MAG: VWA domain-containing protein, partial [Verrucomicrobiae bacterium]|nr:VWA domain-containing protein [Verrucomicrobiae bacterium]